MRTVGPVTSRLPAIACAFLVAAGAAQAQTSAVDAQPSREVLDDAAKEGCSATSVVVRRCATAPATSNTSGKPADPRDRLTRSRTRAKAAFERRDRQGEQDALDDKPPPPASGDAANASRLAPITVTGKAAEETPTIEEVLQRALNPTQVVAPNGNTITYGPDGARTECQAHCTGPMCCKTMKSRPDPARESNSIGR